jgi:hypothetical protein
LSAALVVVGVGPRVGMRPYVSTPRRLERQDVPPWWGLVKVSMSVGGLTEHSDISHQKNDLYGCYPLAWAF